MTRLTYEEAVLLNLREQTRKNSRVYMSKEYAYHLLKELTGQDFSYDADAWEKWLKTHEYDAAAWRKAAGRLSS